MTNTFNIAPQWVADTKDIGWGTLPTADANTISSNLDAWYGFRELLMKSVSAGKLFSTNIISTYDNLNAQEYLGAVLAPNGDVHFVPGQTQRGQKVSASGVVSTYSLVATSSSVSLYWGGALAPNGDIHFAPLGASVGQKVSASGIVSTYSLSHTATGGSYAGAVVDSKGDLHFVPYYASSGQKILASNGNRQTYFLQKTHDIFNDTWGAYMGGVLAPNGEVHFVPYGATVGQKISVSGVVSTYALAYTNYANLGDFGSPGYSGGIVALNGDIHFIPYIAEVGQKVSLNGTVSTYPILSGGYRSGVLAPNGDIHMLSAGAAPGQKISIDGTVSTYTFLESTISFYSGVLDMQGNIHVIRGDGAALNVKINTMSKPFDSAITLSPWLNKTP